MEKETTYRRLFDLFAEPGDEFGEAWVETFEERIIEEGNLIAAHYWGTDNPGAGAGAISIYAFEGLLFSFDGEEIEGPCETFAQAADESSLLTISDATRRIWVDYRGNSCEDD